MVVEAGDVELMAGDVTTPERYGDSHFSRGLQAWRLILLRNFVPLSWSEILTTTQ